MTPVTPVLNTLLSALNSFQIKKIFTAIYFAKAVKFKPASFG